MLRVCQWGRSTWLGCEVVVQEGRADCARSVVGMVLRGGRYTKPPGWTGHNDSFSTLSFLVLNTVRVDTDRIFLKNTQTK